MYVCKVLTRTLLLYDQMFDIDNDDDDGIKWIRRSLEN